MSALARLDDRVLPVLARALARLVGWRRARAAALAAAVAAAVILGGAGVWLTGSSAPAPVSVDPSGIAVLGPATGESLQAYAQQASSRLAAMLRAHDPSTYAVIDFAGYETAGQVAVATHGLLLPLAYVRARVPGVATAVYPVRVAGAAELPAELTALAARSRVEAIDEGQVAKLPGAVLPAGKAAVLRARIAGLRAEAAVFGPNCGCVFAVIVYGSPSALTRLAREPSVRFVDPAPSYVGFAGLAVQWVLPETTGRFPGVARLPDLLTVP